MSRKKQIPMDERDERNIGSAAVWATLITMLLTFVKVIYYLGFSQREDLSFLLWDLVLLLLIVVVVLGITYFKKTFVLPRTFLGNKLVTEKTRPAKHQRMLKSYLPEAFIFAIGFTVGSHLFESYDNLTQWITNGVIYFVIAYGITHLWGEWTVKRYNRELEN